MNSDVVKKSYRPSGCFLSFDVALAEMLGLHAALVYSVLYIIRKRFRHFKNNDYEILEELYSHLSFMDKFDIFSAVTILKSNDLFEETEI